MLVVSSRRARSRLKHDERASQKIFSFSPLSCACKYANMCAAIRCLTPFERLHAAFQDYIYWLAPGRPLQVSEQLARETRSAEAMRARAG